MKLEDELQRMRELAPLTTITLDGVERRRSHRNRSRRIATISVALLVSLIGTSLLVRAFDRENDAVVPAVDLGLPSGSFYFEQVDHYNLVPGDGPAVETATERLWLAHDGSGRFTYDGHIVNFEPVTGGQPHQDLTFAPGEAPWTWMDLPTDPDELRAVLLERAAPNGESPVPPTPGPAIAEDDWRLFRAADDLLTRDGVYLPPPQRQALFEVLRQAPFVEVTEGAVDPLGRSATLLTLNVDGDRFAWYFDATTGQWLARVYEKPSTGEVLIADLMVSQGIASARTVDSLGDPMVEPASSEVPSFIADADAGVDGTEESPTPNPLAGTTLLDAIPPHSFDAPTLDGLRLNPTFAGHPTVAIAWGSWCEPCLPTLNAVDEVFSSTPGVVAIGIVGEDDRDGAQALVADRHYSFPSVVVDSLRHADMTVAPTVWVLDPEGHVVRSFDGSVDASSLRAAVAQAEDPFQASLLGVDVSGLTALGWRQIGEEKPARIQAWAAAAGTDSWSEEQVVQAMDVLTEAWGDGSGPVYVNELAARRALLCSGLPADHPYRGGEYCD